MVLKSDLDLEASAVVANCRMNRERRAVGTNSYAEELRFDPIAFVNGRLRERGRAIWVDLCCGVGNALVECAAAAEAEFGTTELKLMGVDLVDGFSEQSHRYPSISFHSVTLRTWTIPTDCDLITCVHGLHYVGDKLGLIKRAVASLASDGLFVANLDLANLRFVDGRSAGRSIVADLRRAGLQYNTRNRLLRCTGTRRLDLKYRYCGADDDAGPNFTRQPAVHSHYATP